MAVLHRRPCRVDDAAQRLRLSEPHPDGCYEAIELFSPGEGSGELPLDRASREYCELGLDMLQDNLKPTVVLMDVQGLSYEYMEIRLRYWESPYRRRKHGFTGAVTP